MIAAGNLARRGGHLLFVFARIHRARGAARVAALLLLLAETFTR